MIYPKTLSDDLKYLSEYYGWTQEDKQEVRKQFTDSSEMVKFFTVLAAAHRAGYKQGASNGYVRLKDWCIQQGLDDPFWEGFDVAAFEQIGEAA